MLIEDGELFSEAEELMRLMEDGELFLEMDHETTRG